MSLGREPINGEEKPGGSSSTILTQTRSYCTEYDKQANEVVTCYHENCYKTQILKQLN